MGTQASGGKLPDGAGGGAEWHEVLRLRVNAFQALTLRSG